MNTDLFPHPDTPINYSIISESQWSATEADPTLLTWNVYVNMLQDVITAKKWFQYLKDMKNYKRQIRQLSV